MTSSLEIARVYMKNGQQRTGVLLDDPFVPENHEDKLRFVCHSRIGEFLNGNESPVEHLDAETIEAIDLYLK